MSLRDTIIDAILTADRIRPSADNIRVYVDGDELLQAFGTRPKVSPIGTTEKFTLLPQASNDTQLWRIRVLGSTSDPIAAIVTNRATWQISWDSGSTRINQRVVSISRNSSDTAWLIVTEQGNSA
jgi:hypothetical protein